jgi:hypothetical protein
MTQLFGEAIMTKDAAGAKPVHKIRSGAIEVAIWAKAGEKGSFYSVTMSRSYKKDDEWKHADSFSGDDVIVLSKLLDMAATWMISNPAKQKAA